MRKLHLLSAAFLVAGLPGSIGAVEAQSPRPSPERVLITNDDGIEDEDRLLALASAFAGVPALAVSGIDEEDPAAPGKIAEWVARLASSRPVRELEAGTYLTVAETPEPDPESDVALYEQHYIVITPMRADEHYEVLLNTLANQVLEIPTPRAVPAGE